MYFSLFKETKNFDFYCMFFSAVCVAQGYHITFVASRSCGDSRQITTNNNQT